MTCSNRQGMRGCCAGEHGGQQNLWLLRLDPDLRKNLLVSSRTSR